MNTALIAKINEFITDNGNGEITGPVLNQVLRDMVNQSVAEVTYAALTTLVTNKHITPGTLYKITDRGDRGIFLTGLTDKALSNDAMRIMLCPKTYKTETLDGNVWKGVWHITKTASINDLFIWGGHVWKNLTGAIGSKINDGELDDTNWQPITKASFSNKEYVEVVMPIYYDFAHDWIERQWKPGQLSAGYPWIVAEGSGSTTNFVDITDWNDNQTAYVFVETFFGLSNNVNCQKFVNVKSMFILGNFNTPIEETVTTSYSYDDGGEISGVIAGNHCLAIRNVNSTGSISGIDHPDELYADHTDDESFYFQYSFTEEVDVDNPSGPIDEGNFIYYNMILHQDVLLTEMIAVGVGLTGDVGAKITIGLETDDETYIEEATLADLNNGIKITTLGNKTTAPFRRFKILAVDGDITGGLLKVSGKYL